MRLAIRHAIEQRFQPAADRVVLRLRLWPRRHAGQRILAWRVTVNGAEVAPLTEDPFGNAVGLWQGTGPIEAAAILAAGSAETEDRAGVTGDLSRQVPAAVFLRATALTAAGEAVRELATAIAPGEPLARLHALQEAVRAAVALRPRLSGAEATAEEALARGGGVAQDHAHVFVAAARELGIPARHVTGYVETAEAGEGGAALHAWAEAMVPGLGWVGFDPSAGLCPTDRYVRLGCGFDARDAAPVTQFATGAPETAAAASVRVAPDADGAEVQSQA